MTPRAFLIATLNVVVSAILDPGTYRAFLSPQFFSGVDCASNWTATLNAVALKLEEPAAPDAVHSVDLRVSLDIEALPTPLRPVAYTSFTWHLNSGWSTWKVAP